jgi:hypothetical protein
MVEARTRELDVKLEADVRCLCGVPKLVNFQIAEGIAFLPLGNSAQGNQQQNRKEELNH